MSALANLYVVYIIKGLKSFSDVPEKLKPLVKAGLEAQDMGHLAEVPTI